MATMQTLYIVSTPIGNLEDITYRAVRTLQQVDIILCEDTRMTSRLCRHYGINTPLRSYHDFSTEKERTHWVSYIQAGHSVALVSDAGTPLITDPGYKLTQLIYAQGVDVQVLPGPVAFVNAVILSGFPPYPIYFSGFLPKTMAQKKIFFSKFLMYGGTGGISGGIGTLVAYDSPLRIQNTLQALHEILGNVPVALAREMTKLHETITRGSVEHLLQNSLDKRGEYTVVVDLSHVQPSVYPWQQAVDKAITKGLSVKAIADILHSVFSDVPKSTLYTYAQTQKEKTHV